MSHAIERRTNGWALVQEAEGKPKKTVKVYKTAQAASAALNVIVFTGGE